MAAEDEATALEFTPMWIVVAVCSLILLLSLVAERVSTTSVRCVCMLCFP
jgi:hypothetical protein